MQRAAQLILAPLNISVNLAGLQIREPSLINQIGLILAETGLHGSSLKLEITESMLMEDVQETINTLLQIRAMNIQLSIDDFGTGYSSLSYLRRLPVNTLKIDRSFVSLMKYDNENFEIVKTITTLAHALGMDVTAEGVEKSSNALKVIYAQTQALATLHACPTPIASPATYLPLTLSSLRVLVRTNFTNRSGDRFNL